ncbi:MAG: cell division protein ZapA [Alphaproteobacteria bacterium]|nr:cell division protein ZapA [Alphaproteobacteria bacterium]
MGQVTITIDKREFAIKCEDGQEGHIIQLSRILDEKAKLLSQSLGMINENMMLAMVGLLLADELQDLKQGKTPSQVLSVENNEDTKISEQLNSQINRITSLIKEIK